MTMGDRSAKVQVLYRLVSTPRWLHDHIDTVLSDPEHVRFRLGKVIDISYREGYMDGYRDGHTDAENGHDERVRASTT